MEVVDADGLIVPTAENEILFELKGAGKVVGLDNGKPDSHEIYQGNRRKTFGGLALALVQTTESGLMLLSASSPGLNPATIRLAAD